MPASRQAVPSSSRVLETGFPQNARSLAEIDLIVIYNSGKFRTDGLPSICGLMPYGNANEIVLELGEDHVLPAVKNTPVLAGVCGTDPTRNMRKFLNQLRDVGFSGVINYPTVSRLTALFAATSSLSGWASPARSK